MHAVFDTESLLRQRTVTAREKHEQQVRDWVAEQQNNVVVVDSLDLSPANSERQIGKAMFAPALEQGLRRLNANLHFEINPWNTSKKALYHTPAGSQKTFICAYENGVMPEHSIMSVKEQEQPDSEFFFRGLKQSKGKFEINRADLPKHRVVNEGTPQQEVLWEDDKTPGFRKTPILWHEAIRGWRTVLIKLVQNRLATPAEVEHIFGADNRPEWASKLGKRTDIRTIL